MVKNLPANAGEETRVRSWGQEDALGEKMATHSSILAWEIPQTGARWATAHGPQKSQRLNKLATKPSTGDAHIVIIRQILKQV